VGIVNGQENEYTFLEEKGELEKKKKKRGKTRGGREGYTIGGGYARFKIGGKKGIFARNTGEKTKGAWGNA